MVTSETPYLSVSEMLEEFGVMTYDEYIAQSRLLRSEPDKLGESDAGLIYDEHPPE